MSACSVNIDKYKVISVLYREDVPDKYNIDLSDDVNWINTVIEFRKRRYSHGYYITSTTEISTIGNTLTYQMKEELRKKVLSFLKYTMNKEY